MSKGAAFRALHERDEAFIIPNPWDIGSARMLASLGFEALATTSAGMAFALGLGDGQVTWDTVLSHCQDIVAATDLPVSADLEKGIGDSPESAAETVRAAAGVGLAGCSLEDYTGDDKNPIFPFDLAVARIEAAVAARDALPDDFVLTARCENLIHGIDDLDDTIRRLQAYETVGADVLYAPGLRDLESVRRVCQSVRKPVNVLPSPGSGFTQSNLSDAGARRISVGSLLARVAYGAFLAASREMADVGSFDYARNAASFAEIETLLGDG
jgi:2-methylisocitrate lyase-like PEP mutase family enzyme